MGGSHVTIIHDALDLTVHRPPTLPRTQIWNPHPPRHQTLDATVPTLAPSPLILTSGDLFKLVHLKTAPEQRLVVAEGQMLSYNG